MAKPVVVFGLAFWEHSHKPKHLQVTRHKGGEGFLFLFVFVRMKKKITLVNKHKIPPLSKNNLYINVMFKPSIVELANNKQCLIL